MLLLLLFLKDQTLFTGFRALISANDNLRLRIWKEWNAYTVVQGKDGVVVGPNLPADSPLGKGSAASVWKACWDLPSSTRRGRQCCLKTQNCLLLPNDLPIWITSLFPMLCLFSKQNKDGHALGTWIILSSRGSRWVNNVQTLCAKYLFERSYGGRHSVNSFRGTKRQLKRKLSHRKPAFPLITNYRTVIKNKKNLSTE